jgi:ribosomal protein L31
MPVILATQEAEIRKITAQDQSEQKAYGTMASHRLDTVVHACHPGYMGKHKLKNHSPGWLGNKARTYLKYNQSQKWLSVRVAQVVECLSI